MKKYFKSKRKVNVFKIVSKFFYVFVLFSVLYLSRFMLEFRLVSSNKEFISYIFNISNLKDNDLNNNVLFNSIFKLIKNDPDEMLKSVFNVEYEKGDTILMNYMEKENIEVQKTVSQEPLVYIYNSHQAEEYVGGNVISAGRVLKEKLDSIGIPTIFEESDILEFMRINNLNHNYSYVASSYYIKETLKNYPNLKLLIDFHRDSVGKDKTTTIINGKSCAKVLFVVGLEHDNYNSNLELASSINNIINSKYDGLSKGILKKEGPGVNGIYNQDLSSNMILLEFGGEENTFEEVVNTIDLMSDVIKEYLNEKK